MFAQNLWVCGIFISVHVCFCFYWYSQIQMNWLCMSSTRTNTKLTKKSDRRIDLKVLELYHPSLSLFLYLCISLSHSHPDRDVASVWFIQRFFLVKNNLKSNQAESYVRIFFSVFFAHLHTYSLFYSDSLSQHFDYLFTFIWWVCDT